MHDKTRLLRVAIALSIALTPGVPAFAQATAETFAATSAAASVRIDNFGRINEHYYRGAQPRDGDYADLAALGVRTIIDLQEAGGDPGEASAVKAAGMSYYRIPMNTRRAPTSDQLALFLTLVNDPAAQPVYVHCQGGRHRTGVMTAAYRMSVDGWKPAAAFAEMKRFDFGPDFLHPEFKKYVLAYDPQTVANATVVATTQQQ